MGACTSTTEIGTIEIGTGVIDMWYEILSTVRPRSIEFVRSSDRGEMTRRTEYYGATRALIETDFSARIGYVVPTTDSIVLRDGGVYVDAVYLYADMADSTGMARFFTHHEAAKIIRSYLSLVSKIFKHHGGEIRSFDGDRVMAIFMGDGAVDKAVRAAFEVNWAVNWVLQGSLLLYLDRYEKVGWRIEHRCGIDAGSAFVVRAGVRGSNDLVSIGDAPNIAAKLSDVKLGRTMITESIWEPLSYSLAYPNGEYVWKDHGLVDLGGRLENVRHSNHEIEVS